MSRALFHLMRVVTVVRCELQMACLNLTSRFDPIVTKSYIHVGESKNRRSDFDEKTPDMNQDLTNSTSKTIQPIVSSPGQVNGDKSDTTPLNSTAGNSTQPCPTLQDVVNENHRCLEHIIQCLGLFSNQLSELQQQISELAHGASEGTNVPTTGRQPSESKKESPCDGTRARLEPAVETDSSFDSYMNQLVESLKNISTDHYQPEGDVHRGMPDFWFNESTGRMPDTIPLEQGEYVPSSVAPESCSNLMAMRELANAAAKIATQLCSKRRKLLFWTRSISGLTLLTGCFILAGVSERLGDFASITGGIMMVIGLSAGLWLQRTSRRTYRNANKRLVLPEPGPGSAGN